MIATSVESLLGGKIDDFANSLQLFERLEYALERRLKDNQDTESVIFQLAICKRKQGKLSEALDLYSNLKKAYPENLDYASAVAALTGGFNSAMSNNVSQPRICPLVEHAEFLPEQVMHNITDRMYQDQYNFYPAEVGGFGEKEGSYQDPEIRNNTALSLKGDPLKKIIRDLILKNLTSTIERLGLGSFEPSRIEVKLRAYHNGEYFRVHQDGGHGRLISFTYFFHVEPRRFNGGELVVFDTDTTNSTFSHSFTRVLPKRNSLFFFPSNYYHAVLPVDTQDDDFMSARFVINGHIWGKQE